MPGAMLHFAYGSNMDAAAMRRRCPGAEPLGTARLHNWRFVVTRDGYASVTPAPGQVVHGVLWRLGARDLAAVNAYEAEARRASRFFRMGHTPGVMANPAAEFNPAFPLTLDLRRMA